jgi:hypothetical protein
LRQPILYAEEMWRRQRLWVVFLVLIGLGMAGFTFWQRRYVASLDLLVFLAYIPAAGVLAAVLFAYRRRSYVQTTDRGLKVSNLLGSVLIDYGSVRWAKVYALSKHFEAKERKRYLRAASRPLLDRSALYVRVGADEAQMDRIRKKLGRTFVDGDVVAVPIPDPDAISWELAGHLPQQAGANLGGQRRGRRRRR